MVASDSSGFLSRDSMKAIFTFSSSSLSSPIIMERTLLVALLTLFGAGMIALYGVPGFLKLELFPIPALRAGFIAWSRVVFKGPVHRTEKKTETGLNRTD
jgi:hypothetical protein